MISQEPISGGVKYSSYTQAQKNASKKYRANNRDRVNEQRKAYYKLRKESDPQFLEVKRAKAREYYLKKKGQDPEDVKQEKEEVKTDEEAKTDEEVKTDEETIIITATPTTPVKPKRTRKPKTVVTEEPVVIEPLTEPLITDALSVVEEVVKKTRKPRVKKEVKTE